MYRRILRLLVFMAAALAPPCAAAQVYTAWHRPVDVSYRQFSTEHFRTIYQRGLHGEARTLALRLEEALPPIRAAVGLRRDLYVPVVLNRFTDRSNGFVTTQPFRQEIEAVPLRGNTLSPRFVDWLETVGPHELVHAVHAESGHGLGVGWVLRRLGPDLARSLNLSGPRGINEGLAVWMESRIRPGAGRLHHAFYDMQYRAAMDSGRPWSLTQMLERPIYTRPFDRHYIGGGHVFDDLAVDGDIPFFRRSRTFYYRLPLLGYGPALWYGTGEPPWVLSRRLRSTARREGEAFLASLGPPTSMTIVAGERGTAYRRPRWLDDGTLLVHARGYHLRPGFYRIDVESGTRVPVASEAISEDVRFDLSGDRVVFARYSLDPFEAIRATSDVFELDVGAGRTRRITRGGRLFAPVRLEDGSIWALRNVDRFNEWVRIAPTGEITPVGAIAETEILAVAPDPQGEFTAVLAHHRGRQGVYRARVHDGRLTSIEPWLHFAHASIYDVAWSPDGNTVLFTADPGGVANVYAWQRNGDRVYRLTNVPYGALEPALSPDATTVAFVNYRHERYDVASMPFDLASAVLWPRDSVRVVSDVPEVLSSRIADDPAEEGRPYRPLRSVRPRMAYPFVVHQRPGSGSDDVSLGWGAGAGLEWSDPLQVWTAHTRAYAQKGSVWGRAQVRAGGFLLRPGAEVFREPSTVVVRRRTAAGVDTLRVGREQWGAGLLLGLPMVLRANVFPTTATARLGTEWRAERLFGRDGETLRTTERRLALRPSGTLALGMQSNPRDLMPNAGATISVFSTLDIWSDGDDRARWIRADAAAYLPFLRRHSTGIKLYGRLLAQNRGGLLDISTFLPRGYETSTIFLGKGTHATAGAELVQPVLYVDDGWLLPPVYVKSLFVYGFAETNRSLTEFSPMRTVLGAGAGAELRLFHNFDMVIRAAPVYRFTTHDWTVAYR